ncbi:bacteriocin biosynthesis cyclodehydratase domain-containing protein [Knoellia remsis]|uniref:Bacteriocin biosynthesis cyclodehydratase domain-containing protein n=1 Tax=Knoellia remsis TaxID=407159 RepID=A0A2T0UYH4_9MICO|nr:TOMM precursor leader peptide-binding protein [Knoellia remsis]PRY62971.1 bacteriocin biosynthesis cyclodehydratase domain-containing protein [Knoellia remsis]
MTEPLIVVDGRGGLPDEIVRQLRLAGAARIQGGPYAADAAEALLALSPRERPRVVVFVANRTVPTQATGPWQHAGVPHLPVTCDGRVATVGPLVVPSRSACWGCHALTIRDLEAVSSLRSSGFVLDPVALPPGGLGLLTASITATVALAVLGGAVHLAGVSTEIEVDGPTVTHRHWPRHPLCRTCGDRGAAAWPATAQDTMAG